MEMDQKKKKKKSSKQRKNCKKWLQLMTTWVGIETNTIIGACVMFLAILIAWNLPILRDFIAGLKVNPLFPKLNS